MPKLKEIAKACKSKNAGPYELTLDIMFEDAETFDKVRRTGVISRELFAKLYNVPTESVVFTEFPPAYAYKATIERRIASGAVGDTDVYGAQQHAPLLDVEIPLPEK
jgi:hypothetical protein